MVKKYYAVKGGRQGPYCIYNCWSRVLEDTYKKTSKFKGFETVEECCEFLGTEDVKMILGDSKLETEDTKRHEVYTDGGCVHNGTRHAAAGVGVNFGGVNDISIPLPGPEQTNNRAELFALLIGIMGVPKDKEAVIHTDSKYSINAVTKWYSKWVDAGSLHEKANWDLIKVVHSALETRPLLTIQHIKGHAGHDGNERADELATEGIKKNQRNKLQM